MNSCAHLILKSCWTMGDRTLMNFPALDEMHIWGTNLFRGFMFYWCYLYLFTYTGEPSKVCMRDITGRCNICQKSRVGLFTLRFHWNVKNCSGIRIKTIKIILQFLCRTWTVKNVFLTFEKSLYCFEILFN
jgi:hypothetical protein